ncbi:MAG: VOC family protein [Pseudomonadales bacterium]
MAGDRPNVMPQIIPYLYYDDAGAAIEFMEQVFGFQVEQAFRDPESNRVLHATVRTGSGVIFVGPGMEAFGTQGMADPDRVPAMTYVFVDDVAAHYERVRSSAATLRSELHEHFGGNRQYTVSDPFGQRWTFAQPVDTPAS